jgi:hypothetical protein
MEVNADLERACGALPSDEAAFGVGLVDCL